jgi:hypothetical protein
MYSLPGPKFFAFAYRITAYQGVMSTLQQQEEERRQPTTTGRETGMSTETPQELPAESTSQISAGMGEFIETAEI